MQKQREEEKRCEEAEKKKQAEIRAAKEKADDISLKESIAKVKSWKQQMRGESPPEDGVTGSIFGKDDWRKRKTLCRGNSTEETPTSPPVVQKGKSQKMFAGVAGFPPVDALADNAAQDNSPRLSAPTSNRSVSPYDNLKPPRHPPSQYENFNKQQRRAGMPASSGKVFQNV